MSGSRKLVYKNNSSNRTQTISVPSIDSSLLVDRERLVCNYDLVVTEEKVLLTVNTLVYDEENNYEQDNKILKGDKERFILVKYVRKDPTIKSTEEAFRETQQGLSKSKIYAGIKINSTDGSIFQYKYCYYHK